MSASRSASDTFSSPQARLVPTSFSSRCRLTSQPSRGVDEANARKPRTVPCTANAIRSSERMSRPARRSASLDCSARTLTVSRISRMRTCSSRERTQGSTSSDSPFSTSGRHCANGPFRGRDGVDALAVAVEEHEENRVGRDCLAQDFEALADHRIGVAGGDVLEIDGDFRAGKIDAERRTIRPRLPQLRRQDVGSRVTQEAIRLAPSAPRWDPPALQGSLAARRRQP